MTDDQIMQIWYDTPAERFGDEVEDAEIIAFARALLSASKPAAIDGPEAVAYVSPHGATRIVLVNGARLNDGDELYAAPLDRGASKGGVAQLIDLRDELLREAEKEGCYTCYREQAAYIARRLTAMLAASPAAPSADAQDERGAFEAWYLHDMPHETYLLKRTKRSYRQPEAYEDDSVDDAWTGWQARAALQSPAHPTAAELPVARCGLSSSIDEVEALSNSEDRGLTTGECESMMLVLHELRRLQMLEVQAVEIVASAAPVESGTRYIVIGYGEADYPCAKLVTAREHLLDAVLGMVYSNPSEVDVIVREAYRKDLADEDEWCGKIWRTEFEIGGITVYDLGYGTASTAAPAQSGCPQCGGSQATWKCTCDPIWPGYAAPAQSGETCKCRDANSDELVLVPRGLLAAAVSAIVNYRDAPNVVGKLRNIYWPAAASPAAVYPAPSVDAKDERDAFDVGLDALADYQRNWDTGLVQPYAESERIAMECAVEAVRDALNDARVAPPHSPSTKEEK